MLWYECKTGVARTSHMKKNSQCYGQICCYCNCSTHCGSNWLTPLFTASNPGLSCTSHTHSIRRECWICTITVVSCLLCHVCFLVLFSVFIKLPHNFTCLRCLIPFMSEVLSRIPL